MRSRVAVLNMTPVTLTKFKFLRSFRVRRLCNSKYVFAFVYSIGALRIFEYWVIPL